jgi:hypothetical protein
VREIWLIAVRGPFESGYTGWTPPLEVSFAAAPGVPRGDNERLPEFVLRRYVTDTLRPVAFAELRDAVDASGPEEGDTGARVLLPRNSWTWR